jgi:predicted nucleotidyltransferase
LKEFVELLLANKTEFVVVGAYALAFHGHPRYTQDIDLFVRNTEANAERIINAIREFGFRTLDIGKGDFMHPDQVVQLGMPPNRIDILTKLSGVEFGDVWERRVEGDLGDLKVFFIDIRDLVMNKLASGRPKDHADIHEVLKDNPEALVPDDGEKA